MKNAWPILAMGAALGVLASWVLMDPAPVPDTSAPFVERVERAEEARQRAQQRADKLADMYVDSLASWNRQRADLWERGQRARAQADSIASALTVTLDSVQTVQFAAYVAERDEEAEALAAERDTWKAETLALRSHVAADSALIASLYAENNAWKALDAERQSIEGALRDALRKQTTKGRLTLALAVVGTAVAVLN